MMRNCVIILLASIFPASTLCAAQYMPFETIQLTDADVEGFPDIAFGDSDSSPVNASAECKEFPGSEGWPLEEEWTRFNESIDGALLQPVPAGAACYSNSPHYDENQCRFVLFNAGLTTFWLDNPLEPLTQWPTGMTCPASLTPAGNCTQGGLPSYVVNATTAKHIQAAVNFARNRNIRLVIKNTGHDFGGRSTGAGSLSIWTHNLKKFEFLPEYSIGEYAGKAVQYASGVQSWELSNQMARNNIALVAPADTVGAAGGWLAAGGHSTITSRYGLGSDQTLSIHVVTADGRLRIAEPGTNDDLFFALRGGGGGTFGVVTSVVMKAYPPTNVTGVSLSFAVNIQGLPGNGTFPPFGSPGVKDVETFWNGVSLYYRFCRRIVDAGGIGFTYIYPQGNNSYSFTASSSFPDLTPAVVSALMQPLHDDLQAAGIDAPNQPGFSFPLGGSRLGGSPQSPSNRRYNSRLFPRAYWEDSDLFTESMAAVRLAVEEGGYVFHGTLHSPTLAVAGWPGRDSAVNPAWREAIMHAMLFYKDAIHPLTSAQARNAEQDINRYVNVWRQLTPGSGAYMNEGDPAEPDWQQSFFGSHYPRLLEVKRAWDPLGCM